MRRHKITSANDQYLIAAQKTIPDAVRQLHKKVAEITADLPSDVQALRRTKAQKEFFDKIAEPFDLVQRFCNQLRTERLALADPQTNLLRHAVDDAASLSVGEVLLAHTFTQIPTEQLHILASLISKPSLLLTLQAAIHPRELSNHGEKSALLDKIAAKPPIDMPRIQALASLELIGLKIELVVVLAVTDEDTPEKKRVLEEQISALQCIIN